MVRTVIVGAIVLSVVAFCIAQQYIPSNASDNTPPIVTGWANTTTVTVWINGNQYPAGSASNLAIQNSISNAGSQYFWNTATYYTFNTISGFPVNPPGNNIVVMQQIPGTMSGNPDPNKVGLTSYTFDTSTGNVLNAWMELNPNIADPGALETDTGHEVSHLYGLGDCWTCGNLNNSIMYNPLPWSSPVSYGPTANDVYYNDLYRPNE